MNRPVCRTASPELLLPAGDFESVIAAVQCGGDAVYLGGRDFSARQNAKNFGQNDLRQAVSYCHTRGVKVYQTLNTLVFDRQLPAAAEMIRAGCEAGVDAFIVQDWGLFALCRELCPEMRLHASTQMSVHTVHGAEQLREMGAKRVVLARELSLAEIREIAEAVDIETEVFVHGALCMSVSGQCYLSGMLGGRSGNRGSCAGTCRLPFGVGHKPGPEDYALSLKDLCLAGRIDELREAGVTSLKVEGRMKRPEYVAAAARAYSDAKQGLPADLETLRAVFSRSGFTDGYFTEKTGPDMFGFRQREDVASATPKLLKSIENTYRGENGRIPLSLRLTARRGEPVRLSAVDCDGNAAEAIGEIPEEARSKPSTEEGLRRLLEKLGGTVFLPGEIAVELEEGLILPASAVNGLRRSVCEEIAARRAVVIPVPCDGDEVRLLEVGAFASSAEKSFSPPRLHARFTRFEQVPFDLLGGMESFSLPVGEVERHTAELAEWREQLVMELPRALFGAEKALAERLTRLRKAGFTRVLCNNIAHLHLARELGLTAQGGVFLNCTNSLSARQLQRLGAAGQTLSFELNLQDARQVRAEIPLGLIVYGYLPLMLLRNCPIRGNGVSCANCDRKQKLTDRMGVKFPVVCDHSSYAQLLNSRPLWLADRLEREFSDFAFHTLYFTIESREECGALIARHKTRAAPPEEFTRGLYYRNI